MSDTTEEAVREVRESSPIVEAACRQIRRQADPEIAELAEEFTGLFFSKAPPEFLRERSTDALARMALGACQFLQRARPDRVDVEILNPDVEEEGWYAPVTVIRTNISERPFIVDTIREFLHSQDLAIEHYIYPVLHVERNEEGRVRQVRPSREGQERESLVHCEVARITDPELRDHLRSEVERRLQDVVRATEDFHPMVDALNDVVAYLAERSQQLPDRSDRLKEIQAFLRWLRDGGFVFLGYRAYNIVDDRESGEPALQVEPGSGLGILRDEARSRYAAPVPLDEMDPNLRTLVKGGPDLIISKTNAEATVHRRARMDYIGVKKLDEDGEVVGEHRFVGLFTSRAYAEEAEKIPILRDKLQRILERAGVQEGTHDYKEIITIFNSMPKEELFLTSAEEIGDDVRTVLTSYHTHEVRVSIREDPLQRGASVMVILPKEKFSGDVRRSIEDVLVERIQGDVLNYHLALGSGDQARLHFYLSTGEKPVDQVSTDELEAEVRELIRTWGDRVRDELERVRPPDEARRLAGVYVDTFSAEYRAATSPDVAVQDILELEAMEADERSVSIAISNPDASPAVAGGERVTELKLYLRDQRLVLSDFMPILENAGLRVIAVTPFEMAEDGDVDAIIYSFAVQDAQGRPLDVEGRGTLLSETILAVRRGDATNDALNALVVSAGLAWREVDVLRAYASYAFQLGVVPSRLSLVSALRKYPGIAGVLFDLFEAKFDPEGPGDMEERRAEMSDIATLLGQGMTEVGLLSDDRALRRLFDLIEATVRTNYFRNGGSTPTRRSGGVPYISFKVACREMDTIKRSRLLYEVWVRSSRMEGIHLRGAKVARGGIRWSDRPDDFRTEILGLARTQMTKNAVIVPAGSKGGFVTLRQADDATDMADEARVQYQTLMRGLLDLTDNLDADGEPVRPEHVLCYDDPDPYLVVAADKGTARFSDVANAVAAEYDFWLGDAFASGGSHGYDHKEVGITARGAWACVDRHFREKGKDIQAEPFTVVGIGDMSGDVFGNGILLSRKIRLIAAFDHRHVFIDPDPDPEASFEERERLFEMGRSTWDDYDRDVLSEGGMIVPRGAKEVEIGPRVREALGLDDEVESLDGESLIRAVLRAPVELLWNGGIGTYVKASTESHADAGDAANDAVRVDAPELRCEVVGEGGNLGFTQRARIEFALAGGRMNTDALDNSGGVDLSDREVNLKILLNPVVKAGRMSMEERNELLGRLTDSVADQVISDNESQSLAISLDEARLEEGVDEFRDLMSSLERAGRLDRMAEALPTWETMVERREAGQSLTRPELCVLLAYAKLDLMSHVLHSELPDDEAAVTYLLDYFPAAAQSEAGKVELGGHRLRREIISSQLTNDLVDLMGSTFVQRVARDTGRRPWEVARAWLVAASLAGHRSILEELTDRRRELPARVVYRWLLGLSRVLSRTTRWILAHVDPERSTSEVIRANLEGLATLRKVFPDIVEGDDRVIFQERVRELVNLGAKESFARNLITLRFLDQLLEILRVAEETGSEPGSAARAFYRVSEVLHVPWLRRSIFDAAGDDRWEQRVAQALAGDLTRGHHRITTRVMDEDAASESVDQAVEHVILRRSRELDRFRSLLEEIRGEEKATLPGLSVAVREVAALADRLEDDEPPRATGAGDGSGAY